MSNFSTGNLGCALVMGASGSHISEFIGGFILRVALPPEDFVFASFSGTGALVPPHPMARNITNSEIIQNCIRPHWPITVRLAILMKTHLIAMKEVSHDCHVAFHMVGSKVWTCS